jgi:mono/diheme cytochrome c family protein
MRGTVMTGWVLLMGAVLLALVLVVGLYAWDVAARTAEAALRPPELAPLALAVETPVALPIAVSSTAAGASTMPPAAAGDAAAGQRAFATHCNSCHPGANAGIGPALYGPQFAQRYPDDKPLIAVVRQGKGGMPALSPAQLGDADLADVIAYLRGLQSGAIAPEPTPTPRPRSRGG